uniref:Protein masquerade-like n=1 Tax=Dermatophagoides pteronyssinus TaxID=6956 RepID=A0A6P6Y0C4_DERPT
QQQQIVDQEKSNETGYFSDLWNTLTTVNRTSTCPGECVHAITSIFCDNVLEDISCGGQLSRCCISNSQYYQIYGHLPTSSSSSSSMENADNFESTEQPLLPSTSASTTITEMFSVISNNHHLTTANRFNNQNQETSTAMTQEPSNANRDDYMEQNSSIKTNPCPVKCISLQNTFCMRPLHDSYCTNPNEECCLEIESTLDTMTKNFIKLVQQTVAMNQTKNIGAEFHSSTPPSSAIMTPSTTSTTSTTTTQSSLPQCDGTCVVPLFHMLCDEIDHNQYCSNGYCCVNREYNTTPLPLSSSLPPPLIISICDGTCLPIILSGMCTKPSELVLKTLDCGQGTICCARGKSIDQDNNGDTRPFHNQQQQNPIISGLQNYPQPPPRIQLPFSIRKNNNQQQPPSITIDTGNNQNNNNKVHFRPSDNLPSSSYSSNDDQSSSTSLINEHNFVVCPGKCINSMFKFTCLGGHSISKHFKCSKGQICCASNTDIEKLELFLLNTKMVQQQQQHQQQQQIPPPPPPPPMVQPNQQSPILQSSSSSNDKPIAVSIPSPPMIKPIIKTHQPIPMSQPSLSSNNENILDLPSQQQQQQSTSIPHQCGKKGSKRSQRVVGGSDSYPGEWCWQIALVNQQNKYICGGVLIGKQWALTAAHCVTNYLRKNEPIFIRAGEYDLTRNNRFGQMQKIQTIFVHHNHNGQSLDNDIALMKLLSPIELNPNTCLVCLPTWNTNRTIQDKLCTVTGYGFQHESGPIALRIREALIPIVNDQDCIMKINSVTEKQFLLPASSFCAGGGHGGNDACQGDGGSGLVCNWNDDYFELTGLVSWGFGCGRNGVPGVYVKVLSFLGWINQIVSTNP